MPRSSSEPPPGSTSQQSCPLCPICAARTLSAPDGAALLPVEPLLAEVLVLMPGQLLRRALGACPPLRVGVRQQSQGYTRRAAGSLASRGSLWDAGCRRGSGFPSLVWGMGQSLVLTGSPPAGTIVEPLLLGAGRPVASRPWAPVSPSAPGLPWCPPHHAPHTEAEGRPPCTKRGQRSRQSPMDALLSLVVLTHGSAPACLVTAL